VGLSDRTPPSLEEYESWREALCNWQRWPEFALGTLNHITPEVRRRASGAVRRGESISLSRPIDTHPSAHNPFPAQHLRAVGDAGGIEDWLGLFLHGYAQTHIDALCHITVPAGDRMWNGVPGDRFSPGAGGLGIEHFRDGIVTRGVLYDIPRLRGKQHIGLGEPVHGWDLADAAAAQAVEPRAGDAVVVRCGREPLADTLADRSVSDPESGFGSGLPAGLHASCAEFLYTTDASLLVWDLLDAPTPDQGIPNTLPIEAPLHLHQLLIPYVGMPLLDNVDLERLARACEAAGQWDFLFVTAPLVIPSGTGSPVNPIAVL
jgi:hypothetical protein